MIKSGDYGLDSIITGLRLGDNVVWQIDSVTEYREFVESFAKQAREDKRTLIYIRFGQHEPLLGKLSATQIYQLDPSLGFETFSTEIHAIIKKHGLGAFYVFDCLSELLSSWSNDLMIGNFFKITCPYLFQLDTVAYFAILRNSHSFKTIARIRDTTQLLIDVYSHDHHRYVHPLKVWNRYSPTMFLPHIRENGELLPIVSSVDTARLFSSVFKMGAGSTRQQLDYWDRIFMKAEDLSAQPDASEEADHLREQIARLIISRDEKILELGRAYLNLEDLLLIKSRMIGTGLIGGKSAGMLLARSILLRENAMPAERIEPHDSYYVGSDVFYSYIVENGWWNLRMEQKSEEGYFKVARDLKDRLLHGVFPEEIKEQFQQMIEYFGQSPIIVRSSSLLEDGYGNAFAGKYESIFLANQGTPEQRYANFVEAVRRVYASTMNEDALEYRRQRGLDKMDEQMALLVQRVSGSVHGDYFLPDAAGVGISRNIFVWREHLEPEAGMLRLVVGLGTRAVNRVEGDYPRIVALDDPILKAHGGPEDAHRFSQHDVDAINLSTNALETVSLRDLLKREIGLDLSMSAVKDYEGDEFAWIVTFDSLLKTTFRDSMQRILKLLEKAYGYPVDTEFTVNFSNGDYQLNLLQCRPMVAKGFGSRVIIPQNIPADRILFESTGGFMGGNISQPVDRVIYVDPKAYSDIPTESGKYDIARLVGELNRRIASEGRPVVMLLGPGRWGTTTPSLGVPVSFAEINHISVLGEIAFRENNVMPELSYGTHFFQDLVETGIFYVALFPQGDKSRLNRALLKDGRPVSAFLPHYQKYDGVVSVADVSSLGLTLMADVVSQKVICYFK